MTSLKKRKARIQDRPAVTVYVTPTCVNCPKTIHLLKEANIVHTVVDLTTDLEAYKYVTQDLGYKQAPIVIVSDGVEQVSWSGHNHEHLQHWIIDRAVEPHMQLVPGVSIDERMAQAHANTTAAMRNSGLGRRTNADHGPELKNNGGGEPA